MTYHDFLNVPRNPKEQNTQLESQSQRETNGCFTVFPSPSQFQHKGSQASHIGSGTTICFLLEWGFQVSVRPFLSHVFGAGVTVVTS